jgi:pyruvate/2-oxoglutarate dehydrogenase complex dihydrolipoamide dehydrogenase (E3) component
VDPDLVVIGGGAAGLGAARWAQRRKASVLLVERDRVGGDCTFTGCVPSKALIESAGRGDTFDTAICAARRAVADIAAGETPDVLGGEGIDVVSAEARLVDRRTVAVDGRKIRPKGVVIAAGSRPALPGIPGLGDVDYLTNETIFELDALPASLAVLGGGPVGVELAQGFARLGSEVTIVEGAGQLLPREEPAAAAVIANALAADGVTVCTERRVVSVCHDSCGRVTLCLSDGSSITADKLLVAVGRQPDTSSLSLDSAGVETDGAGYIKVDDRMRTTAAGVFAAGDVAQRLQFTHVAYETGMIAAANALAPLAVLRFKPRFTPWVTFSSPEVARVGCLEADTASCGGRVAYLPMSEVDRAVAAGRTRGFVKLVTVPRIGSRHIGGGKIAGATIVAERAGEMLSEVALAMRTRMFPARLVLTTHAYPTWSTAIQQAAAQLFGEHGGRRWQPASASPTERESPVLSPGENVGACPVAARQ